MSTTNWNQCIYIFPLNIKVAEGGVMITVKKNVCNWMSQEAVPLRQDLKRGFKIFPTKQLHRGFNCFVNIQQWPVFVCRKIVEWTKAGGAGGHTFYTHMRCSGKELKKPVRNCRFHTKRVKRGCVSMIWKLKGIACLLNILEGWWL